VLLFYNLSFASLLHHLIVLYLPPQQLLYPLLVFRLDLRVDPLLKIESNCLLEITGKDSKSIEWNARNESK